VQSILTAQGFRCAVEEEQLLTGSGLFNVYATRPGTPGPSLVADLQNKADQLVSALAGFAPTAAVPTLIALCPAQSRRGAEAAALKLVEDDLLRRLESVPNLFALGARALTARYPDADWFNAQTDRLGHIPYSDAGFAALGTSVFRAFAAYRRAPYKVIALDCDHTLWDGGVGEDGPIGVRVNGARRALQEFMLSQLRAGMILCLCSKNRDADVWAVFAENPGMVLKREHVAAARINWAPKSENLRSLAAELGVGLDSFIFVDDNPVECAEVRANCPGPLVVELPAEGGAAAARLEQVWAFDHVRTTAEDAKRTQMVREGAQRERFRGEVGTLEDFIAGLELKVEIFEPQAGDWPRVAQLTQRTNQFNFTNIRRTEGELRQFLEGAGAHALAITVRDRFGDYGLVGVALYEAKADCYRIDTFLLSCRVLGRGVEHQVLAEIGRRAEAEGKAEVELAVTETERNLPAREFVREVAGERGMALPANEVARLKFKPEAVSRRPGAEGGSGVSPPSLTRKRRDAASAFNPEQYPTAEAIAAAIEADRLRTAGFAPDVAAESLPVDLTSQLLRLWRKTLGNPRVGLDDNFLDVGGTSLKAVQLVAAIRRELQRPVSVVTFFECPTVRKLSEKLEPKAPPPVAAAPAGQGDDAMARGARRNQRLRRPREGA